MYHPHPNRPVFDDCSTTDTDTSYDIEQSTESDGESYYGAGSFYDPELITEDPMDDFEPTHRAVPTLVPHDSSFSIANPEPDPSSSVSRGVGIIRSRGNECLSPPEPDIWTGSNQAYPSTPFGNGPGTTLEALDRTSKRDHQSGNYYNPVVRRPRIVNRAALERGDCARDREYQSTVSFDLTPQYADTIDPYGATPGIYPRSSGTTLGTRGALTPSHSSPSAACNPHGIIGATTAHHANSLRSDLKSEYKDPFDSYDFADIFDEEDLPIPTKPSSIILSSTNLWSLVNASRPREKAVAAKSAARLIQRLQDSAENGSLAFLSNFIIKIELPDGTKADLQTRHVLFKIDLGEYLPPSFIKISNDKKVMFMIKGCEDLPKTASLISADYVIELYRSSKIKANAIIRDEVEKVTKTIEDRIEAWSAGGVIAFMNKTEVMVEMPFRVNKHVVAAFETELARSIDKDLTKVERYCPEGYPCTYVIKVSFQTAKGI